MNIISAGYTIVIWGTGYYGKRMAIKLKKNELDYSFWVDSNESKIDTIVDDKNVFSKEKINSKSFVVIAIKNNYQEIIDYLESKKIAWVDIKMLKQKR